MNKIKLVVVALLLITTQTSACAEEKEPNIKGLQKKILKFAPGMDTNGDGEISVDELKEGRSKLPREMQVLLDAALSKIKDSTEKSATVKAKPVVGDIPKRNNATPFIDPLFKITETKNIEFAKAKSGDKEIPLLLDIYRPTPSADLPKKLPAMILLFGGGWKKGSKDIKYIRDLCEYYATRGYVAYSIQYRIQKDNPPALPGPAPFPETIT